MVFDSYKDAVAHVRAHGQDLPHRTNHRLPIGAYAESDREFFVTMCARHLGEPFRDDDLARRIVDALLWRRERHLWVLHCYCLMPDHLHFLLALKEAPARLVNAGARGTVPDGILEQIGYFKSYTTSQLWWKAGGEGPLWQKSTFDRALRCNDSIGPAVRYILDNPVKKGLVARWNEYPYSAIVDGW